MPKFDLRAYLAQRRELVEAELERRLPDLPAELDRLKEAMAYCLMAGGKRLRPILCLAGAEMAGRRPETVLPTACALEFIHTYSLIHDDLPAMDDDLTEAFGLLSDQAQTHPPGLVVEVVGMIARAAGARGMVGGQAADLAAEALSRVEVSRVEFIHARKTGALINVALAAGAKLAGAGQADLEALETYGRAIGAAFQIADDLLDIEGQTEIMGKPVGSDEVRGKATYPAAVGPAQARKQAQALIEEAKTSLKRFGQAAQPLLSLADYIINRSR